MLLADNELATVRQPPVGLGSYRELLSCSEPAYRGCLGSGLSACVYERI
jgi:hypothetical protein